MSIKWADKSRAKVLTKETIGLRSMFDLCIFGER